jgi:hypothetical protein
MLAAERLMSIEASLRDVPLIYLRLRRSNCRSRRCDAVVSGLHFLPPGR